MAREYNHYAFLDYKKPHENKPDYRTATHLGLVNLADSKTSAKNRIRTNECNQYQRPMGLLDSYKSEHREHFTWQPFNPSDIRNPSLACATVKYIKPFEESVLRSAPKPLQELTSTYRKEFTYQPVKYSEAPPVMILPNAVVNSPITIEKAKPGHSKYLDVNATSMGLSYVDYLKDQTDGIGCKDQITFWNWGQTCGNSLENIEGFEENMCQKTESKKCPKRRNEFQCTVKHVPYAGMTTETRSNYKLPVATVMFDASNVCNPMNSCLSAEFAESTESKLYGSGDRVQRYINVGRPEIIP